MSMSNKDYPKLGSSLIKLAPKSYRVDFNHRKKLATSSLQRIAMREKTQIAEEALGEVIMLAQSFILSILTQSLLYIVTEYRKSSHFEIMACAYLWKYVFLYLWKYSFT